MPFGRGEGRDAFRWEVKGGGNNDGDGGDGGKRKMKKKKRISDRGVKTQHPTIENLIRMKDFVRVGEEVAREEAGVPIWVRRRRRRRRRGVVEERWFSGYMMLVE